jgi:phenylacetate-CoA ligase
MGRADQRTKVKGMFVDPKQIAEVLKQHGEIARARLVVTRDREMDAMALHVETADGVALDEKAVAATLREVTKLAGNIVPTKTGALPNDGKVIADERDYSQ